MVARKEIYSVNTIVPGDDIIEVDYSSNQTLLDADVVLFSPTLDLPSARSILDRETDRSAETMSYLSRQQNHWKSEIIQAASNGKLVVVFLNSPSIETSQNFSVYPKEVSSYDALPHVESHSAIAGTKMKLANSGSIIASYWHEFSHLSSYQVEVTGDFSGILLESAVGGRIIGAIKKYEREGAVLFLPDVDFFVDEYLEEEDDEWTKQGLQAGKRFVSEIVALTNTLAADSSATPPPDWTRDDRFKLPTESDIEQRISGIQEKLTQLQTSKRNLETDLASAAEPRRLLFEKGALLEDAILDGLRLMGFGAARFREGDSEFDGIITSPEGQRYIGEAEGRDSKAINVDKLDQLQRNLLEDYQREEINEMARGILFGNGHRLLSPEKRSEAFTEKCQNVAKRNGYILVRTADMFQPVRYIGENPDDVNYVSACRSAIADAVGEIVQFPATPDEGERDEE